MQALKSQKRCNMIMRLQKHPTIRLRCPIMWYHTETQVMRHRVISVVSNRCKDETSASNEGRCNNDIMLQQSYSLFVVALTKEQKGRCYKVIILQQRTGSTRTQMRKKPLPFPSRPRALARSVELAEAFQYVFLHLLPKLSPVYPTAYRKTITIQ